MARAIREGRNIAFKFPLLRLELRFSPWDRGLISIPEIVHRHLAGAGYHISDMRSLRSQLADCFLKAVFVAFLGVLLCGCATNYRRGLQYQIDHNYCVDDPQFLRTMGQLMGPGLMASNQITSLVNGDEIFPAMLEAIRSAQKTITLETYIYFSGQIGRQFADALAERARAGVKVHVLMDWLGSRAVDSSDIRRMKDAGVEVIKYNPLVWYSPLRLNHRNHRKLLIVDGRIGFIGGVGIADMWLGNADSPDHWRDSHFRLEGPGVGQMQAAFMDNWMKSSARVLDGEAYFPALDAKGQSLVQVFYSSPKDGAESVRLMYLLSIAAASKNIRLSASYFVPGPLTTEELIAACERGVNVEIIMPGAQTDSPLVRYASRAKWGPLLKAGVKIYEYQPTMYHCKSMVIDDVWVSVGSANFDNRSFRLNDEANMNVYSREFAAEQIALFEKDKTQARLVTYKEWKKRGFFKKILEWTTSPLRGLL
jgi:cardiolipin synthase